MDGRSNSSKNAFSWQYLSMVNIMIINRDKKEEENDRWKTKKNDYIYCIVFSLYSFNSLETEPENQEKCNACIHYIHDLY